MQIPIGTIDFETDPFLFGRVPYPFAVCIYFSDRDYSLHWEPNIIEKTIRALMHLPKCILYAHNGGKFDFHYLLEYADKENILIRNSRIVQMQIGRATLKDSWPLMPFPLEEFRKTPIDYAIFNAHRRNSQRNKARIKSYLVDDCRDLLELVTGFRAVVGPKDTIGSAAFYQMRECGIRIKSLNEAHDDTFRPYFFGGRVEALQKGIHRGAYKYLDINSAYPYAMTFNHPHGNDYLSGERLLARNILGPCFVHCRAYSHGALPFRAEDGSLSFPDVPFKQDYFATGWEIAAGLDTKTLKIDRVHQVWIPQTFICFREYILKFFALRQQAKRENDPIKRLAYKYLLNSGYGKFAQNPRDFKTYMLAEFGDDVPGYDWESDYGNICLWSQSSYDGFGFFDVATGASITGFVRAMLWRAMCQSKDVLYVDTDSMICKSSRVHIGEELGQWKLEGQVKKCAIAGKKLYAVDWGRPVDRKNPDSRYKIASKGARLTFRQILALCDGKSIIWKNDAPTFSLTGAHFVEREITAT
jgi:hypothetical protein